jgi:GTP-binding protein HflX
MTTIYENLKKAEKALLISVDTGEADAAESLAELAELCKTAGAETVATVTQKRQSLDPNTCIGSGKLSEIAETIKVSPDPIDLVIFDLELSPTQTRNIEKELAIRVIDRTTLILDIFAKHAFSAEGKLQVELAQLKYKLPRLIGQNDNLSRLGGTIGTRGPGETKLEINRRYLRLRIDTLSKKLKELETRRNNMRARRQKDRITTVAIVGYTNAGKSTLLNKLTKSDVLSEDKLFATLDPTARNLRLPGGKNVMLVDTVGFIRRLPHKLVEAFKSTLEEATAADLILNVCDASGAEALTHIDVTEKILAELKCQSPIVTVFNKCDKLKNAAPVATKLTNGHGQDGNNGSKVNADNNNDADDGNDNDTAHGNNDNGNHNNNGAELLLAAKQNSVRVSAITGQNLDELLLMIEKKLTK